MVNRGMTGDKPQMLREGWSMVQRNIEKVSELALDLLRYSKERTPEVDLCAPNEIVTDVRDLVSDVAESNDIEIITRCDPNLGQMWLDPGTVHRTLLNLVNNAMDACLEQEDPDRQFKVEIRTRKTQKRAAVFEIEDNGCGMDEQTRTRLFTPMFSSKGGKGTGLGLLVTKKLVEEHGGTIDITTRLGYGSVFVVTLPERPETARDQTDK